MMIDILRDKWETYRLQTRYKKLVQQRVLEMAEAATESHCPTPVVDDETGWELLGGSRALTESERIEARTRARQLIRSQPHAKNGLRMLEIYIVVAGLMLSHMPLRSSEESDALSRKADSLWLRFLEGNRRHFSYREYAVRTWRDGECFLRTFPKAVWPPAVRFVDPETIGPTEEHPDSEGVLTEPHDVESPLAYLRIDPITGAHVETIPAGEMFHTKIGVDSNEKRGVTVFAPVLDSLDDFARWMETELVARKLQSSIVLWRKVSGSPTAATAFADTAEYSSSSDALHAVERKRVQAGTMLTTSTGTELEFLHPNSNYTDAVPLGRLLLLCIAAGLGLPEYMLTSDASNANFASTKIAEGPAVRLFESEQEFFAAEFERIWRWVMFGAIEQDRLPVDFFDRIAPKWTFPLIVTRERVREREVDVRLVEANILSRAEIARRDGVDPAVMKRELADEPNGK